MSSIFNIFILPVTFMKAYAFSNKLLFFNAYFIISRTELQYVLSNGTDIYLCSKMLTLKNVSTTQIYVEVIDGRKRKAAESISIKKKEIVKFFNYKR